MNKILNLIKPNKKVLYARSCEIKIVDSTDEKIFLNENHLQGYVKSQIAIGLYYNGILISIMTFGKPRYNRNYQYELLRYCSSEKVVGGSKRLFKYFLNTYKPESIISYCDKSKFLGNMYLDLGFTLSSNKLTPSKHWYNIKTKSHITDNLLRQHGFDRLLGDQYGYYGKGTSNEELMLRNNYVEIYDAGQATYKWKKL